jgi:hypothetical protein
MAGKGGSKAAAVVLPPVKPGSTPSVSGRNGVEIQASPRTIRATGKGAH